MINFSSVCIEDHLVEIQKLYDDDRVKECIDYAKKLEDQILSGDIYSRDNKDEDMTDYEYFKSIDLILRIYEENDLYYKAWEAFKDLQTRPADKIENEIESWYRKEEDTRLITISGRVNINTNINIILSYYNEIELRANPKFNVKVLREFSDFRKLVKATLKSEIIGYDDRECISLGFGISLQNTNSVILPFKSIGDNSYGIKEKFPVSNNCTRLTVNYGFVHVKYMSENTTQVTNCYNIDPKLDLIPDFILNTFIKNYPKENLSDLKNLLENGDVEKYKNSIINKKQVYNKMTRLINSNNS